MVGRESNAAHFACTGPRFGSTLQHSLARKFVEDINIRTHERLFLELNCAK